MTDLDELLEANPASPETALGGTATPRKCRHQWTGYLQPDDTYEWRCSRCGRPQDPIRSRRGKSSARFGKDQERRIERVYGPRKVGEFGDAVDHIGRDFVWQSKASRNPPALWLQDVTDAMWRTSIPADWWGVMQRMVPLAAHRFPLLIRSWVRNGIGSRDWIVVEAHHWYWVHGGNYVAGYIVMTGAYFLDVHGRDEP